MDIVTVTNLTKTFGHGPRQVKALDGITLGVEKGKFTAIVGASGSGKTTLLHCIGGLYRPDSGTVTVDGQDLASLPEEQLTVYPWPWMTPARTGTFFGRSPACWGSQESWMPCPTPSPAGPSSAPPSPGP